MVALQQVCWNPVQVQASARALSFVLGHTQIYSFSASISLYTGEKLGTGEFNVGGKPCKGLASS